MEISQKVNTVILDNYIPFLKFTKNLASRFTTNEADLENRYKLKWKLVPPAYFYSFKVIPT